MTGKKVPVPTTRVDTINPKRLPYRVTLSETARLAQEMAEARQQWATMQPSERLGNEGRRLFGRYRTLSYQFKELTGQEPPRIYADQ